MDERRGRAIFYLVGSVAVAVGCAAASGWWAGAIAFGGLCVLGSIIGRVRT